MDQFIAWGTAILCIATPATYIFLCFKRVDLK